MADLKLQYSIIFLLTLLILSVKLSAIVGKKDIFMGMQHAKMDGTFFGSSLAMVAAYTTIRILQDTDM